MISASAVAPSSTRPPICSVRRKRTTSAAALRAAWARRRCIRFWRGLDFGRVRLSPMIRILRFPRGTYRKVRREADLIAGFTGWRAARWVRQSGRA
ncbi:hypothetical protein GCM10028775_00920 [Catellatospora paridis]